MQEASDSNSIGTLHCSKHKGLSGDNAILIKQIVATTVHIINHLRLPCLLYFFQDFNLCLFFGFDRGELPIEVLFFIGVK